MFQTLHLCHKIGILKYNKRPPFRLMCTGFFQFQVPHENGIFDFFLHFALNVSTKVGKGKIIISTSVLLRAALTWMVKSNPNDQTGSVIWLVAPKDTGKGHFFFTFSTFDYTKKSKI